MDHTSLNLLMALSKDFEKMLGELPDMTLEMKWCAQSEVQLETTLVM